MAITGSVILDITGSNFNAYQVISAEAGEVASRNGDGYYLRGDGYYVKFVNYGNDWSVRFYQHFDDLNSEWEFDNKARNLIDLNVKGLVNTGALMQPIKVAYNQFKNYYNEISHRANMGPLHLPIEYTAANGVQFHIYVDHNK